MASIGPVQVSVVRGSPVRVFDRTLVPMARLTSVHGHRGTVRMESADGMGWRVEFVRPLAIVQERAGAAKVLPIADRTGTVLWQMALMAIAVSVVGCVLIVANRRARGR